MLLVLLKEGDEVGALIMEEMSAKPEARPAIQSRKAVNNATPESRGRS